MRKYMIVLLLLVMLCLWGCGVRQSGPVTYRVTVTDDAGNPIEGAAVQLCKDSCIPGFTDENGVAIFTAPADDYKVAFMRLPEGYTSGQEEFFFEKGSAELTIRLTPIS